MRKSRAPFEGAAEKELYNHLAVWLLGCPGNKQGGGKRPSEATAPWNPYLRASLRKHNAIMALAHDILVILSSSKTCSRPAG